MFEVVFTPAAIVELIDAQDWYEGEASGLGRRFYSGIELLVERIIANPLQFPVVHKDVRLALLRRFPYKMFFIIDGQTILVIACFHASRDPGDWQQRV